MLSENEEAFLSELYRRCAKSLYQYSLALLHAIPDAPSLAEECMQETFEMALRKIKKLAKHQAQEAWLFATCKRITISRRRKILNRARITGTQYSIEDGYSVADQHDGINAWVEENDRQHKKQRLLEALTQQEKTVLHFYFEEELSVKDCAERLCMTEAAVQGTIQRIRKKAKKVGI